jgi:two-component system OmpR family sensor kinase
VTERLTRNELAWLLAQEAKSAAQKLRRGVGVDLSETTPAPTILDDMSGGIEGALDHLDDVVGQLASLHGPSAPRRRGRIDIATLVWEVAPDAKTQLEMGEGTGVFGDETELRRMLHILIGQTGDPAGSRGSAAITVRRDGTDVKISVHLGPDKTPTFDVERTWLSRMALRYGGRLELDGVTQTLALPADVDERVQEIQELRRELAEAQAQGEAYARELAAVFTRAEASAQSEPRRPAAPGGVAAIVTACRAAGASLRGVLAAIGRDIVPLRAAPGEASAIAASVSRHLAAGLEMAGDFAQLGAFPTAEAPRAMDVAELARDVAKQCAMRAARHGVSVRVLGPELHETLAPQGLATLVTAALAHCIAVSPDGSEVLISVEEGRSGLHIHLDDAGPGGTVVAGNGPWGAEWEATLAARGGGLSLVAAHAIAQQLGVGFEAREASSSSGGGRIRISVPRGTP